MQKILMCLKCKLEIKNSLSDQGAINGKMTTSNLNALFFPFREKVMEENTDDNRVFCRTIMGKNVLR